MARADLRGLLGNLDAAKPTEPDSPLASQTTPIRVVETVAVSQEKPSAKPLSVAPSADRSESRFSDFERKETRLRVDQQDALTTLARQLNRAKRAGNPRITDNTLIRVAVDLLLARGVKLAGNDEAELRRSLGLKERER